MENTLYFDLAPDEAAMQERHGEYVVLDQEVRLWLDRNRVGLTRLSIQRHPPAEQSGDAVLEIVLRVIADADPDCRFESLRLTLDFSNTPNVLVRDMVPAEVLGKDPVKITSKWIKGLSLEMEQFKLGPSFSHEHSIESQVYLPEIRGIGIGFNKAVWTFDHLPGAPLYAINKDLRLLVSLPSHLNALPANGTIRVEIARQGWTRVLPLIGHQAMHIDLPENLASQL